MSTPILCTCGNDYVYPSQASLRQHQRRYCRGQRPVEAGEMCVYCDQRFPVYAGLRQHIRLAHPVEYNMELEVEVDAINRRRIWTEGEVPRMAEAEANFVGSASALLNHLCDLTQRTRESVKGKRKSLEYKQLVVRLKMGSVANMVGNNVSVIAEAGSDEVLNSVGDEASGVVIQGDEIEEANLPNVTGDQRRDDGDVVLNCLVNLSLELDELDDQAVMAAIIRNDDESKNKLDTWTEKLAKKYGKATRNRSNRGNLAEIMAGMNRRKRRVLEYKRAQKDYRHNRKMYANRLLDGRSSEDVAVKPTNIEIENAYCEIFGTCSEADTEGTVACIRETVNLYRAIGVNDISKALSDTAASTAAGPDGVDLAAMLKIPVKKLAMLYNAMLFLQYVPKTFRVSRTSLIPKTDQNLQLVNNWRPITVSSLLLRTCHKIVALRLRAVQLSESQRGFVDIDGVYANNTIVQAIVKQMRRRAKAFSIISLDVKKAFDIVAHRSIRRAMRRLGVDDKTAGFIMSGYEDATTSISCLGVVCCNVPVKRGVKQGDPISPLLFNMVLDELICDLDGQRGLSVGQANMSCMAYADDLLLLSSNVGDAKVRENRKFFHGKRTGTQCVQMQKHCVRGSASEKEVVCAYASRL